MFYRIEDFMKEWSIESSTTQRVLDAITDEALTREIADGFSSLGSLGWHICQAYGGILHHTGLVFEVPSKYEPVPIHAAAISTKYKEVGSGMKVAIQTNWTDSSLLEHVDVYGESWTKGATLHMLIKHEIHHRGQMAVLIRQAGLRLPDIYGPTKETRMEQRANRET